MLFATGRSPRPLALLAVALISPASSNTVANAGPRPSVTLAVPAQVDAGAVVPITWTAKHLRPHSRLVVQRQMGTARVWRTIMALSAPTGTSQLPAFKLGLYHLRIAAIDSRRRVSAEQRVILRVFGDVPMSELVNGDPGVYTTPSRTFAYVIKQDEELDGGHVLTIAHSHCRQVHIDFVPGNPYAPDNEIGTVSVLQEAQDPVSASGPKETIGSLDATLELGRSWSLTVNDNRGHNVFVFYINGSANCDRIGF